MLFLRTTLYLLSLVLISGPLLPAQISAVKPDGACISCTSSTPHSSAVLEIQATDKGILIPRVANVDAVSSPAVGLLVYDNSTLRFKYYDGSAWREIGGMVEHLAFPETGNTFIGVGVGIANSTGFENTAVGEHAFHSNTNGYLNTASGRQALYSNVEGYRNAAFGQDALFSNTEGYRNTATGEDALYSNTSGWLNTAVGNRALFSNTSGIENTATGNEALFSNSTGDENIAGGHRALYANTTGSSNTAVGAYALQANTIGFYNTAMGNLALSVNQASSWNTALGYGALNSVNANGVTNSTAIGFDAELTASNHIRLGNNSIMEIGGIVNWSMFSDARFKSKIRADVPGLKFITRLNPVTYQMDVEAIARFYHTPDSLRLLDAETEKSGIRYSGFLAQEVEAAASAIAYDFSGVDKPQHERDHYSLRYAEFVVPLVKAVQEQQEQIEAKELIIKKQQEQIDVLENRLVRIELLLQDGNNHRLNLDNSEAPRLDQNTPNPFRAKTQINYYLPATVDFAQLHITDKAGRLVRSLELRGRGKGHVDIKTTSFPAGIYQYSLIVDGQRIATKQMVLMNID